MTPTPFSLRRIAVPAFGPSLLFGLGEGAILPVLPVRGDAIPQAQASSAAGYQSFSRL